MAENVIQFNAQDRLLGKVNHYISAFDQLISDGDDALSLLLAAFDVADEDTKIKIVLLLGALANTKVVPPLLAIMKDSNEAESIRQAAAIQISVVGSLIQETDDLVDRLLEDLKSDAPFDRANAAFALGWEGNRRATPHLIECLLDSACEVQQAAVNALSNLQEDRIFAVLTERLQQSAKEQQRTILYNLGHFTARHYEITQICKSFLQHLDADLRYDALVVLNTVSDPSDNLDVYQRSLKDDDARIRQLALNHLAGLEADVLITVEGAIRGALKDDNSNVYQAAIRLLHQMQPAALVPLGNP